MKTTTLLKCLLTALFAVCMSVATYAAEGDSVSMITDGNIDNFAGAWTGQGLSGNVSSYSTTGNVSVTLDADAAAWYSHGFFNKQQNFIEYGDTVRASFYASSSVAGAQIYVVVNAGAQTIDGVSVGGMTAGKYVALEQGAKRYDVDIVLGGDGVNISTRDVYQFKFYFQSAGTFVVDSFNVCTIEKAFSSKISLIDNGSFTYTNSNAWASTATVGTAVFSVTAQKEQQVNVSDNGGGVWYAVQLFNKRLNNLGDETKNVYVSIKAKANVDNAVITTVLNSSAFDAKPQFSIFGNDITLGQTYQWYNTVIALGADKTLDSDNWKFIMAFRTVADYTIDSVEVYTLSTETNIVRSAMASAEASNNDKTPDNANDGITADWSGWTGKIGDGSVSCWLDFTWESPQTFNRVELFANSNLSYNIDGYTIQYWDGSAYQDAATISDNNQVQVTSTFQSVTTTKLRILCTDPDDASLYYRIEEVQAYYDPQELTMQAVSGNGSVNPSVGNHFFGEYDNIELTATAETGYKFDKWMIDGSDVSENPTTVSMSAAVSAKAYFIEETSTKLSNATSSAIAVFPNPTNGLLHISTDELYNVELVNLSGVIVSSSIMETQTKTMDLSHLSHGVYFIRLSNAENVHLQKIVKK